MATVRGGLVHYYGHCRDCEKEWYTRNAMGLAAQHAQRYGHQAWVETGYHHELTPDGIEPKRE